MLYNILATKLERFVMYADHPPPNSPSNCSDRVLVLEESDKPYEVDRIVEQARDVGAVTEEEGVRVDNEETFWIVYENTPGRVWDFTERALRSTLKAENALP